MRIQALAATSLVLALVACNKSGDQTGAGGTPGNASAGSSTAPVAAPSGAATIQPGLWEVSYETHVTGVNVPPAYAAAMNHKDSKRDCITPEEAARPVTMMKEKGSSCDYSGFTFGNGRIQGTITCGGKGGESGKISMTMNGQYDADNYAYTSSMTNQEGGMNMVMETKAVAHRVGECPAGGGDDSH